MDDELQNPQTVINIPIAKASAENNDCGSQSSRREQRTIAPGGAKRNPEDSWKLTAESCLSLRHSIRLPLNLLDTAEDAIAVRASYRREVADGEAEIREHKLR